MSERSNDQTPPTDVPDLQTESGELGAKEAATGAPEGATAVAEASATEETPAAGESTAGEATAAEIDAEADRAAALVAEQDRRDDEQREQEQTDEEPRGEERRDEERRGEDREDRVRADPTAELLQLLDLTTRYPEIGPPLAELAFKIGHGDIGERVVRMGLQGASPGVEYYFVAASAARREKRYAEALSRTLAAVRAFAGREPLDADEGSRLLHLVRMGFGILLFDLENISAHPEFVVDLTDALPALEPRLGTDPFFHVLMAMTLWFSDRDASEREWQRAAELGEPEHTWNARGTWYKEAEKDQDKAERAYRAGLEQAPHGPLLLHNLAQTLVEKAGRADVDVEDARRMLREADDLLRAALREDAPKGLRRHVHSTRDRLMALRSSLPPRGRRDRGEPREHREPREYREPREPREHRREPRAEQGGEPADRAPAVGDVVRGKVVSLAAYGAFISVGRGQVGLLHKSEIAHERIDDPASALAVGEEVEVKVLEVDRGDRGRLRIGLSRRALLPAPAGAERRDRGGEGARGGGGGRGGDRRDRGPRRDEPRGPSDKFLGGGKVSLGEMILAKLKEQEGK